MSNASVEIILCLISLILALTIPLSESQLSILYNNFSSIDIQDYPKILHFNHAISPFGNQNCLIILDNFRGIDLDDNQFPIILRQSIQLKPILILADNSSTTSNYLHLVISKC